MSMRMRCLALGLSLLTLAGCSEGGSTGSLRPEREERLYSVAVDAQGRGTTLTSEAGCLDKARLTVEDESSGAVTLRYFVRRWDSDGGPVPACATQTTVTLSAPLGDRRVLDAKTGQRVEVIKR